MKKMSPHKTLKLIRKVKKVVEDIDVLLEPTGEQKDSVIVKFKSKEQLRRERIRKNLKEAAKKLDW